MRVIDIENIVTNMKDDTRFVLRCEEVFHDKISSAAASILMNKGQKPIVCLICTMLPMWLSMRENLRYSLLWQN